MALAKRKISQNLVMAAQCRARDFLYFFCVFWTYLSIANGYETCPNGRDFCPDGDTCCPMGVSIDDVSARSTYGCVPTDMGSNASCCGDGKTACPRDYKCVSDEPRCKGTDVITDPLVQRLPRYILCKAPALREVHGLPIRPDEDPLAKLAYYSSQGDITLPHPETERAIVVIHGARRNADDYFCSAHAMLTLHRSATLNNTLFVAPRFLEVSDGPVLLEEGGDALRWNETDGSTGSSSGPWRHGADSVYPASNTEAVSSFDALDTLVATLSNQSLYPNLNHITIVGHSSGGQTVQRWTLLTSIDWDGRRLKSVVANPSSYAYLTPLRKYENNWAVPSDGDTCSSLYDQWQWGLEDGGDMDVRYKQREFAKLGHDLDALIRRFAERRVVYLAGGADRCNTSDYDNNAWCYSHGLETSCMDMQQGPTRWDRNLRYIESLRLVGISEKNHTREVVPGVGHDHALIFTSVQGMIAVFGNDWPTLVGAPKKPRSVGA